VTASPLFAWPFSVEKTPKVTEPATVEVIKEVPVEVIKEVPAANDTLQVQSLMSSVDSQLATLDSLSKELETLKNSLQSSKKTSTTSSDTLTSLQNGLETSRSLLNEYDKNYRSLEATARKQQKELDRIHFGLGAGATYLPSTGEFGISADLSARWNSVMFIGGVGYPATADNFKVFDPDALSYHASLLYEF